MTVTWYKTNNVSFENLTLATLKYGAREPYARCARILLIFFTSFIHNVYKLPWLLWLHIGA